jgi:hypothetical protein
MMAWLTPVATPPPVSPPSMYISVREDVTTGVIDTGGKLAAGVNYSIPVVD